MSTLQNQPSLGVKAYLTQPIAQFLIKAGLIYFIWECLNWYWMHNDWFKVIWMGWHDIIRHNIVIISAAMLRFFGYDIVQHHYILQIIGSAGVDVGPACAGFGLLFGFAGLILSYHGSWQSKLWFIPLGWMGIHFINILRIVILTVVSSINNDWVEFNHKYVFNTLVYIFIFLMWVARLRMVEREEQALKSKQS